MQKFITRPLLILALDEVPYISETVTQQQPRALSEFAVESVLLSSASRAGAGGYVGRGAPHRACYGVLGDLEYGMERAQAVCNIRVSTLQKELEKVQKKEEFCLRRHSKKTLLELKGKVREVLLTAMNGGLKAGMIHPVKQGGGVLRQKHRYAPPPLVGTGIPMATLAFTPLRGLVEEGAGSIIIERQMFSTQASEKAASERKGVPSAEGQRTGHTQGRAVAGRGSGSTFEARML